MTLKLGILDQSIVFPGQTPAEALNNTIKLVQLAEKLGFERFWVSEHHDSAGMAGSSPEVLISHLLARTEKIKIGSGGVMLQHYSPYKVAENFNLLASLAPGRVELGIGRAPGGLPRSTKALQKGVVDSPSLAEKLIELEHFLQGSSGEGQPIEGLQANPLPVQPADIYLLGTSINSAELAAERGYPYAFALFINNDPETAHKAFEAYRNGFNKERGGEPRSILALSVIAADTDEEAIELAGSFKSVRVTLASGKTVNVGSLEQAEEFAKQAGETFTAEVRDAEITKGTKETVRKRLLELKETFGVDELIFTTIIPDFNKRVRSFELLKEAFSELPVQG
ncbi:alkane 1-monooxygenase [Paenibacillus baekrokdamisoli]|uniref:Alkane 1-monooxygenase n=1 Tax=Paenibacillus baekrokdamisoli TaxID=1712516 RepID=A0A3G9J722_9BACL|nr:LLM class flavin-dependent oxidoreductase [Paenibacillus baekrokdamisoli]MBB3071152.1 luciferase family oxidoreductase group 1 [Paenibacillus baekrokdamisoli]BBH21571.1 alkane 1-monooxygenase [Paenibacillus baekrokdamisoli]